MNLPPLKPGQVYSPWEFITEEVVERKWSMTGLLVRLDCGFGAVVTPALAAKLGEVFGTSPTLWLMLQQQFSDQQADGPTPSASPVSPPSEG